MERLHALSVPTKTTQALDGVDKRRKSLIPADQGQFKPLVLFFFYFFLGHSVQSSAHALITSPSASLVNTYNHELSGLDINP
jgi:hypothetical protein